MSAAFVVFGVGVVLFGLTVASIWRRPLLGLDVSVSGLATLGVALFPLSAAGGGAEDTRHATCATVGYLTLALAPVLGRRAVGLPRLSLPFALLSAIFLALSTVGSLTGLWQRLGLSFGDAWLLVLAARLYDRAQPEGRPPRH
jgi:hypothetical protein